MAQLITVKLSRFDGSPWGFRLQGGKDFGTPLVVQKVNGGSPAEQAGLKTGDAVIRVNTADVFNLRHKDAQDIIVRSGNSFELTVQRGGATWRPTTSPVTPSIPSPQPSAPASCVSPVTKTSLIAKKQDEPMIGSGHNLAPKPFINGRNDGSIKSIVNKQYNSPVGMYSEETIAETLSAQAEVLAGGVLGVNFKKNEKDYNAQNSEVFKMVQEADKEPRSPEPAEPAMNMNVVTRSPPTIPGLRSVSAPEPKPQPTTPQSSLPPGQNICADCERLIVGVFVRIKEKNLHVECFKCSTCGTSLKNVGYYNINNKLYCDIHAKLIARQQAPSGLGPITGQPGNKAPESTILAALANHDRTGPISPPLSSQGSPQLFSSHAAHDFTGPKPFGSSVPPSSFSVPNIGNSGSNSRPQSQTVTVSAERYREQFENYESIDLTIEDPMRARCDQPSQDQRPPSSCSSVRNKSLVWPPIKPIEDITYPTASPIWIDPNPILEKRRRANPCDKRVAVREIVECYCDSRSSGHCYCGYGEREYERYSSLSRSSNREGSIDRTGCSQSFNRKSEMSDTRRKCRVSTYTPRPGSADGLRRSLTPTRISQPVPRPWMATVTSGTSSYRHVQPPTPPQSEIICRETCRCQIVCEKTAGYQGRDHEHTYREICCDSCRPPVVSRQTCRRYTEPPKTEPPRTNKRTENDVIDLSKVVPPDVAVCPKGVENQHNLYTETMEKDVGDIHIKKTTIYEKTVEVLSPERARSPEPEEPRAVESNDEPRELSIEEETVQRSSATLDREVERISDRSTAQGSTEILTSAITTAQLMDEARQDEERRRADYEKIRREEEERLRRQEQECLEQQRRYEEERARRIQKKRVAFTGSDTIKTSQDCDRSKDCYRCESWTEKSCDEEITEGSYGEITEDVKIQENLEETDNERHRSLREQVEIHQCIREQQVPEKRPSLQERRLSSRFRDNSADSVEQSTKVLSQQSDSCQKKHVQFVAPSKTSVGRLPPTTIKNATAKEWKSDMLNALTTAPARPYSPFNEFSGQPENDSEAVTRTVYTTQIRHEDPCGHQCPKTEFTCERENNGPAMSRTVYTTQIRYEDPCGPCPKPTPQPPPQERPVSPFQTALMTAPERPYTPLGCEWGESHDSVICVDRSRTPIDLVTGDGYCHPAEILYTDDKTREAQSRERNLRKVEGPQPLPVPPHNHRLRDCSASPANSLSRPGTPKDRSIMAGLKKPGTIPSYQRYLVSMQQDANDSHVYVPSRSPTPNRSLTPAQVTIGESTGCFVRAQAPRIRESPAPPVYRASTSHVQQTPLMSERQEYVSYHVESDAPSGHNEQDYRASQTSYVTADYRSDDVSNMRESQAVEDYQRSSSKSCITVQRNAGNNDDPSCGIGKVNRVKPSLACPLAHCSERFPKTGVRVLPPCPLPCVSPVTTGKTMTTCSKSSGGYRSGSCKIEVGDCPTLGVTVSACADGSVCVGPRSVTGYSPVQSVDRVERIPSSKTKLPYPQIPVQSWETEKTSNSWGSCQVTSQSDCQRQQETSSCSDNVQSFQPIREPRTNLSNQLTRLTIKRDKQNVGHNCNVDKQSQMFSHCSTIDNNESQIKTSYRGIQVTVPNVDNRKTTDPKNLSWQPNLGSGIGGPIGAGRNGKLAGSSAPTRGRGILNQAGGPGSRQPLCGHCNSHVRGPFITALGQIWCPEHFVCVNSQCRRALQDIGFVEEKGQLHCEYCFERFIAPACNKCNGKIKGDCLNAVGKHFHPECFNCSYCGKLFGNNPFFLEEGLAYCESDWNELFTTKCYACGFPVEAGDRWVEALNNNYHSQCFNCTMCKKNLEGQSFYAKGGRPFCKNHAR